MRLPWCYSFGGRFHIYLTTAVSIDTCTFAQDRIMQRMDGNGLSMDFKRVSRGNRHKISQMAREKVTREWLRENGYERSFAKKRNGDFKQLQIMDNGQNTESFAEICLIVQYMSTYVTS